MTPLLEVENLVKHFGDVRAVDGVSLTLQPGETLALVGRSGWRKGTLGPGRERAGPGPQPASGLAKATRRGLPVRGPQSGGGAAHRPPDGGDVPGPNRRSRSDGGGVRPAAPPVHAGAAVGGAGRGPGAA